MSDIFREAPMGQLIRYITHNKYLQYPEEKPDFKCPTCYSHEDAPKSEVVERQRTRDSITTTMSIDETVSSPQEKPPLERANSSFQEKPDVERTGSYTALERTGSYAGLERISSRAALEKARTLQDLEAPIIPSRVATIPEEPVQPATLQDGTILVDWYTTDDPANPQNWSLAKKCFVTLQIW